MTVEGSSPRFLLDGMLGKLTTYLRMCGYDTCYTLDVGLEADDAIRAYARREKRLLVTRDRDLAARTGSVILLESHELEGQLRELSSAGIGLEPADTPQHCGTCNGELREVDPATDTPDSVPDPGRERVWRCVACGQHFWKGSHWADVANRLERLADG